VKVERLVTNPTNRTTLGDGSRGMMTNDGRDADPETMAAIERALQAAQLRAVDSPEASVASTTTDWEPSAAESGDIGEGVDGE
jgi:hypothetical protein